MKKSAVGVAVAMSGVLLLGVGQAWSLSSETTILLDLLKAKGVISQKDAEEFTNTLATKGPAISEENHYHSVRSLTDRVERLEGKGGEELADSARKVDLSALVEVALSTARAKDGAGNGTNSSDLSLATAQLNVDATINEYVNTHLALLYEEDPADSGHNNVTLDEAIVAFSGGERWPIYANVGRMYVPFGNFASHFISDPLTLVMGETNDTAIVAGYANDIIDLNAGGFKGKVKESGKSDQVNSAVASARFSLPKANKDGLAITGGISYLSNLATSDGLEAETIISGEVAETVGGFSAYLSLAYAERFFVEAEYLGAMDSFVAGDLRFIDSQNRKPRAWNLEAAARLDEKTEVAMRYGGSEETGNFLADREYGAVLQYDIFAHTAITMEYLFQEFQDNSDNRQATMQLAVEF